MSGNNVDTRTETLFTLIMTTNTEQGVLHRHEDGTEHRHFDVGDGRFVSDDDGSDDHSHGVLGTDEQSTGWVVWTEVGQ